MTPKFVLRTAHGERARRDTDEREGDAVEDVMELFGHGAGVTSCEDAPRAALQGSVTYTPRENSPLGGVFPTIIALRALTPNQVRPALART